MACYFLNNDARYQASRKHPQNLLNKVQYEYTVGMPNGRFSSLPGLSSHWRLVGATFEPNLRLATSLIRAAGDR
ncbi:MAG: hypothetical protein ACRDEA_01335, partial [Microcystaceae cyanobacterium]